MHAWIETFIIISNHLITNRYYISEEREVGDSKKKTGVWSGEVCPVSQNWGVSGTILPSDEGAELQSWYLTTWS